MTIAAETPPQTETWDELCTLRPTVRRLRCELASARSEVDDLRRELDRLTETHHGKRLACVRADLRDLTEWLYSTEIACPLDDPPEVVDLEPAGPHEDAPLPIDLESWAVSRG